MADRLTQKQIAEMRSRCEAATKGLWHNTRASLWNVDGDLITADDDGLNPQFYEIADAEFCAHARADIPALLDEVERLTKERDAANDRVGDALNALEAFNENGELEYAVYSSMYDAIAAIMPCPVDEAKEG